MQSKKFDLRYDLIRAVAAILVVGIHSDALTLSATNYLGGGSWWVAAFLNSLGRSAVPLFVMLSGALVLPKIKSLDFALSWQRVKDRLLLPTVLWTIIYFVWQIHWFGLPISSILAKFWHGQIGHLYYLYIAIGLYLAIPLFIRIIKGRELLYKFLFVTVPLLCAYLFFPHDISSSLGIILLWLPYLGYLLLGSSQPVITGNIKRILLLLGIFLSSAISAYLLYLGNSRGNVWWMSGGQSYFWGHFSPTTIISTLSIWFLFLSFPESWLSKFDKPLRLFAGSSFGIYLIHPFIITYLERRLGFEIHLWSSNLIINYLGKWTLAVIISLFIVHLIRKLRLSKYLLGETTYVQK